VTNGAPAAAAAAQAAAAGTGVPAPPPGWTTEFSDDFNGQARSAPSSANWRYDTGPGSSFGTGEIETMTNSTSNGYLDGNGNLDLTALDQGGSWTSARLQTTSANVGAPAGGELEAGSQRLTGQMAAGLLRADDLSRQFRDVLLCDMAAALINQYLTADTLSRLDMLYTFINNKIKC